MTIHRKNGISYFTFSILEQLGITHGIFMRHGGVSGEPWSSLNMATSVGDSRENVIENRRRITACLDRCSDSIYDVWQVHSNRVDYTSSPRPLTAPHKKADAIVTDKLNITLLMLFADCVPILFYDKKNNVAAIAHAGWQGTVKRVVVKTINVMVEKHNCSKDDLIACIGPSICADHYPVGNDVVDAASKELEDIGQTLINKNGNIHFDLQNTNKHLIEKEGVHTIQMADICTAENTIDWFSHRAESGKTGRFAAVMSCLDM